MNITTLSTWVLIIAETLESYGVDYKKLFQDLGLNVNALNNANARYDYDAVMKLWQVAADVAEDPCFGLRTVNHMRPTSLHALGYSWMASATLHDAFIRLKRYVRIVNNSVEIEIQELESETRVAIKPSSKQLILFPTAVDASLCLIVHLCRLTYGRELRPVKVETTRHKHDKECAEKINTYFNAPMQYEMHQNSIYFDKNLLNKPLPASNAELARANDIVVSKYLSYLDGTSIAIRTKTKITELLPTGNASEDRIASLLNLSVRSLQRKLKEETTSFKDLLNDTRRELAEEYMELSRMSINEITYLLGFSDPANFSRAFRRWHGISPSQYRQNLSANVS